jgi:hypothetical protein
MLQVGAIGIEEEEEEEKEYVPLKIYYDSYISPKYY